MKMKKNFKIVQINGLRGLLLTFFIFSCFIAGFIAFPAFLTMNTWNFFAFKIGSVPSITFYEGLLLWAIIVFSIFVFNKKRFIVSFNASQELTEDELKNVISKIKSQTFNPNILPPEEFNFSKDKKEITQQSPDSKDGQ
jgi:hypothetical protein